jgi:hypothetical protein
MNIINLYYYGKIYIIEKEPFETNDIAYKRAWFIVKNYDKYNYNELVSLSKININKNNDMIY